MTAITVRTSRLLRLPGTATGRSDELAPGPPKALKDYYAQKKQGIDPQFDPRPLGIRNADFWEMRADQRAANAVAGSATSGGSVHDGGPGSTAQR